MQKEDNKVRKNFRIRPDIAAELDGLVKLLNLERPLGTHAITETFVIESAIAAYVKTIKKGVELKWRGRTTLEP